MCEYDRRTARLPGKCLLTLTDEENQPTMTQPRPDSSNSALIPALLLFGGLTLILMALFAARPSVQPGEPVALRPTTEPTIEVIESPTVEPTVVAVNVLDPAKVAAGETIFQTTCAACHGFNAQGITGLGKTMIGSTFINGLTDDELLAFLNEGRDVSDPLNTTGVTMPAKGGNPALTDNDLYNVIAYIRSLNQPSDSAAVEPTAVPTASGPTPTPYVFVPLPLSSGDSTSEPTDVEPTPAPQASLFGSVGEALYVQNCAGCHGIDGGGVAYLSQPLSESTLLAERNGFGLLSFLNEAHPPVNPEVEFPHPYRGGYPELTDDELQQVIVYLYTLPSTP